MHEHKHERSDVRIKPVAVTLAVIFATIALVMFGMHWLSVYFAAHQPKPEVELSPLIVAPQIPPDPRLQPSPALDVRQMRAAEDAVLNSYGWVNRKSGVVRIPIDRAIDEVVRKGLPVRKQ